MPHPGCGVRGWGQIHVVRKDRSVSFHKLGGQGLAPVSSLPECVRPGNASQGEDEAAHKVLKSLASGSGGPKAQAAVPLPS